MKDNIATKTISAAVKDVDISGRMITGYFSKFGNVDTMNEIVTAGAFTKTISENGPVGKNRIFHLWQHRTEQVLGKPKTLSEDDYGLYFETVFPDTVLANDVLKMYDAGILNEHSIGYTEIKTEKLSDGITALRELKLWEGSTVTWGANELAVFTGMKSAERINYLSERIDNLTKSLRIGSYSDEGFRILEYELNQVKQFISELKEPAPVATPKTNEAELKELGKMFDKLINKIKN